MKTIQKQQGDICFESAKIPEGAKKVERTFFAEGEGHHVHEPSNLNNIEWFEYDDKTYFKVLKNIKVEHNVKGIKAKGEHGGFELPIGEYIYENINEYDYFNEMKRKVVD